MKLVTGTSLSVQWLRLRTSPAGGVCSKSLVRELRFCTPASTKTKSLVTTQVMKTVTHGPWGVASLSPHSGHEETLRDSWEQWGNGTGEENWTYRLLGKPERRSPGTCQLLCPSPPHWGCAPTLGSLRLLIDQTSSAKFFNQRTLLPDSVPLTPEHKTSFLEGLARASASQVAGVE